jgi:hypothetical protein
MHGHDGVKTDLAGDALCFLPTLLYRFFGFLPLKCTPFVTLDLRGAGGYSDSHVHQPQVLMPWLTDRSTR